MNDFYQQAMEVPSLLETPVWFQSKMMAARADWQDKPLPVIERVKFHRWPLFQERMGDLTALMQPLSYGVQAAVEGNEYVAGQIVQAGNQTLMASLSQDLIDQGVIVADLFEAMATHSDLVSEYLFSVIDATQDKVTSYHTAFLNGGVFIYIPKGVVVTLPIETILIQDSRYAQAFNKHVLIVVEEQAQLEYLERLQTQGEVPNSATICVEVVAKAGAQIKYAALDTLGSQTHGYIKRYARNDANAVIDWAIGVFNQGNVIVDLDTYLDGEGSQSQVQIVGISSHKQVQAVDTKVVNRGAYSVANILQHGVILDSATLTFNGIGLIEKYAKHADAQQESRVLMLSEKARGDANPILLIEEYEVVAGHAASVGQVDEEQLYYLMSRGLTRQTAEHMVTRGFLGPVILQMPSQQVKEEIIQIIDQKLATISE